MAALYHRQEIEDPWATHWIWDAGFEEGQILSLEGEDNQIERGEYEDIPIERYKDHQSPSVLILLDSRTQAPQTPNASSAIRFTTIKPSVSSNNARITHLRHFPSIYLPSSPRPGSSAGTTKCPHHGIGKNSPCGPYRCGSRSPDWVQ